MFMRPGRQRQLAVVIGTPLLLVLLLVSSACASKNISVEIDDDAAITARVKTALLNDRQIGATRIDVTTADRVVTISGPVKSKADEERAVQIVRAVPGVGDVRSVLRIAD
jgi:hyperosmotically inducible protein